ncbi:PLP-dependent lyase/thiolase [Candidatus Peregrinibacteria bacterium]|nr:PLP-dependent lyase/thiolase [Candidatus Peregrinibacteria bacterium]MBI3816956.1 PLP-dependent lyase/thiolase [Candidatus Peregrinibacteria bacterium]
MTKITSPTPLTPLPSDPRIFVKREDQNPCGTHKDRRNALAVQRALDAAIHMLVTITSGNQGCSLKFLAEGTGIRVVNIIDAHVDPAIEQALVQAGSAVRRASLSRELSSEEIIALARRNCSERIMDVTHGYEDAFISIIEELQSLCPDVIVAPVGSGELFVGLHQGIELYGLPTSLIGVGVRATRNSIADKLPARWTPYRDQIQSILRDPRHRLLRLTEAEVRTCVERAREEGIPMEPSAAVVLGAIDRLPEDARNVVLINTGKGLVPER